MRVRAGWFVLALVLLFTTACLPPLGSTDAPWLGPAAGPQLVVLGDSITWQAQGNYDLETDKFHLLSDDLAADGWRVSVSSMIGANLTDASDTWDALGNKSPTDSVIIALGTNDLKDATDTTTASAQLSSIVAAIREAAPGVCIAVVGVNEGASNWWADPATPTEWNQAVPGLVDVFAPWVPDPAWMDPGDVHFNGEAGRAAYRLTIEGAADACAGRSPR